MAEMLTLHQAMKKVREFVKSNSHRKIKVIYERQDDDSVIVCLYGIPRRIECQYTFETITLHMRDLADGSGLRELISEIDTTANDWQKSPWGRGNT